MSKYKISIQPSTCNNNLRTRKLAETTRLAKQEPIDRVLHYRKIVDRQLQKETILKEMLEAESIEKKANSVDISV